MAISRETVEHLGRLTRLGMSDSEIERMTREIAGILEHISRLQVVDTGEIPPMAQIIPLTNVMRSDETRPSLSTDDVLRNAPERDGNFFEVPAIFGD